MSRYRDNLLIRGAPKVACGSSRRPPIVPTPPAIPYVGRPGGGTIPPLGWTFNRSRRRSTVYAEEKAPSVSTGTASSHSSPAATSTSPP
jgi:hypothetical protein